MAIVLADTLNALEDVHREGMVYALMGVNMYEGLRLTSKRRWYTGIQNSGFGVGVYGTPFSLPATAPSQPSASRVSGAAASSAP